MSSELDQFKLEKTTTALFEAGKKAGKSFLLLVALLVAASILVFGEISESSVKVPGLPITLDKSYAALVFSVLCCAGYFQWAVFHSYQRLLYEKAEMLATSMEDKTFHWYFYYPSMFFFLEQIADESPRHVKIVGVTLSVGLLLTGLVYPVYLLFLIGAELHYPIFWWLAVAISILFLIMAIVVFSFSSASLKGVIERLEKYEIGGLSGGR